MEYSKKALAAMAETIRAYEQAILDVEENGDDEIKVAASWGGWANDNECRLCRACEFPKSWGACRRCPLGPVTAGCEYGGMFREVWHVASDAYFEGEMNDGYESGDWIRGVKTRLAWMIKKIGKNGLEVVDK